MRTFIFHFSFILFLDIYLYSLVPFLNQFGFIVLYEMWSQGVFLRNIFLLQLSTACLWSKTEQTIDVILDYILEYWFGF